MSVIRIDTGDDAHLDALRACEPLVESGSPLAALNTARHEVTAPLLAAWGYVKAAPSGRETRYRPASIRTIVITYD